MYIPTSMGTQHPDSASRYIPIQEEADEAVEALTPQPEGLGIEEFMIDFEGKMTPYHQTAEVAHKLLAKGLTPGEDVWITPRISSATEETVFRQLMALMSIIEADYDIMKSSRGKSSEGAIQEVILPMVKGAEDLLALRRRIADIIELAHKEFGLEKNPNALQVIPLVEDIPGMLKFSQFYQKYFTASQKVGFTHNRLRFMMARSDSALSYGLIPSVLAIKIMLAQAYKLGEKLELEVAPILGGGALPFRGHITLENLPNILQDFRGIRTLTLQSGIRYDHEPEVVKKLTNFLRKELPWSQPHFYEQKEETFLRDCLVRFSHHYLRVFHEIIPITATLSDIIPQQRDRLTRRGPGGYARSTIDSGNLASFTDDKELQKTLKKMKKEDFTKVPRAITFTGALYSVGLPPEFLGVGQGLQEVAHIYGKEGISRLVSSYPGIKNDLAFASRFLSLEVAAKFFPKDFINTIHHQVSLIEEYLGLSLLNQGDKAYQTLLQIIEPLVSQTVRGESLEVEDKALLKSCMIRLGKLRGSLG